MQKCYSADDPLINQGSRFISNSNFSAISNKNPANSALLTLSIVFCIKLSHSCKLFWMRLFRPILTRIDAAATKVSSSKSSQNIISSIDFIKFSFSKSNFRFEGAFGCEIKSSIAIVMARMKLKLLAACWDPLDCCDFRLESIDKTSIWNQIFGN